MLVGKILWESLSLADLGASTVFGHRHRLQTVIVICGSADFTSSSDSPKNGTGEKRRNECVQVRPAAPLFPPSHK